MLRTNLREAQLEIIQQLAEELTSIFPIDLATIFNLVSMINIGRTDSQRAAECLGRYTRLLQHANAQLGCSHCGF